MTAPHVRKTRAALLSIFSNISLILFKVAVGLLIGSVSVISEAIHSAVDLLAAVIAFFAVRTSHKPADSDHPFGHGKIENISGTIEALLIFLAAGWIIWEAVRKLLHPVPLEQAHWGVIVMGISALVNAGVSRRLFKVGTETGSIALQADAWHLRTDVWTSLGVMGGLGFLAVGQRWFPGMDLRWLDPVSAIGVALLILRAAYHLTIESGRDLLDTRLDPSEENWIRQLIRDASPAICGFHRLRTRRSGESRFIEFHLLVEPEMTVEASHHLTMIITERITRQFPGASVTIHIEPCNGSCSEICLTGCLLETPAREKVQAKYRRIPRRS